MLAAAHSQHYASAGCCSRPQASPAPWQPQQQQAQPQQQPQQQQQGRHSTVLPQEVALSLQQRYRCPPALPPAAAPEQPATTATTSGAKRARSQDPAAAAVSAAPNTTTASASAPDAAEGRPSKRARGGDTQQAAAPSAVQPDNELPAHIISLTGTLSEWRSPPDDSDVEASTPVGTEFLMQFNWQQDEPEKMEEDVAVVGGMDILASEAGLDVVLDVEMDLLL
jgi:hypothetical protein